MPSLSWIFASFFLGPTHCRIPVSATSLCCWSWWNSGIWGANHLSGSGNFWACSGIPLQWPTSTSTCWNQTKSSSLQQRHYKLQRSKFNSIHMCSRLHIVDGVRSLFKSAHIALSNSDLLLCIRERENCINLLKVYNSNKDDHRCTVPKERKESASTSKVMVFPVSVLTCNFQARRSCGKPWWICQTKGQRSASWAQRLTVAHGNGEFVWLEVFEPRKNTTFTTIKPSKIVL